MKCSEEHPLTEELVMEAKARGLNKSSAPKRLDEELVTFNHRPLMQTVMDSAVRSYRGPCGTAGCCKRNEVLRGSSNFLHRSFFQRMKRVLDKECLISGDVVVALRFPEDDSIALPEVDTRIFMIPKVVLKPEYAVLIEMDANWKDNTARLRPHAKTGVCCARSIDLAVDLLNVSPAPTSLWLNVLAHTPVLLGCGVASKFGQ